MEAFCRRCDFSTESVDHELLSRGDCPQCGGQLFVGGEPVPDERVSGAVGMMFEAGSRIAVPLQTSFEERTLPGIAPAPPDELPPPSLNEEAPPPPPPVEEPVAREPPAAPPAAMFDAGGDDDVTNPAFVPPFSTELAASGDAAGSDAAALAETPTAEFPAFAAPLTAEDTTPDAVPGAGLEPPALWDSAPMSGFAPAAAPESEPAVPVEAPESPVASGMGWDAPVAAPDGAAPENAWASTPPDSAPESTPEQSASEESTSESAWEGVAAGDVPESAAPSAAAPADLPAHLQLPAIDFSLPPDIGVVAPSAGSAPAASASAADLPAHLQLPSFPQFELPPVPGVEVPGKQHLTGEIAVEGIAGGSFGAMDEAQAGGVPAHLQPPSAGAAAEGWSLGSPQTVAAPPPPRPPPPRKNKAKAAAAQAQAPAGGLPELPPLALPNIQSQQTKREPTLVHSDVAAELARRRKRSPMVAVSVVLVVLVGVGAGVWLGWDLILAQLAPAEAAAVVETKEDKARALVAAGRASYDAGKYDAAVQSFHRALEHWPSYGDAHRALGIVYAKLNQAAKAVDHYRIYLSLAPNAEDTAEVRKIVTDYEKHAAKAEAAKPEPPPAPSPPVKTKGRRR